MSTALTIANGASNIASYSPDWARQQEKLDLLKRTFADGTSDDEFSLFVEVAKSSGLNPFQRQIYAIMRNVKVRDRGGERWEKRMTIQTGIDGYRLIAARTGVHAGTSDAEFGQVNDKGQPEWARVTVKKLLPGGHIAEFPATARWDEYVQTKDGKPTGMWEKMPFNQLAKCAEALGLRKAFPAELSGIYTADEMAQADSHAINTEVTNVATADPSPPRDAWDVAQRRLRAVTSEAAKKLGITAKAAAECLKDLVKLRTGHTSTKDCTPEMLHALADEIQSEPAALVPEALGEVVDSDIPSFDPEAPFTGGESTEA